MKNLIRICLLGLPLLPFSALADKNVTVPPHKAYQAECSACHVAYPPSMLSRQDWAKMMSGLNKHYGSNATLDDKTLADIRQYLAANGADSGGRYSSASLRITDTPAFRRKHHEVPNRMWQDAKVKNGANCGACHQGADKGSFSERDLRTPDGRRWEDD
ncbi:MAG TPA: diheme cytochrome c [Rhodocyclaceae bacterium]